MGIGEELGDAIARIRKGLEEIRAGAGGIVDLAKKGAIEAADKALDEAMKSAMKSIVRVKEALAEAEMKAENEPEETRVPTKEHLSKARKAVASIEQELNGAAAKIKAKSTGGTEEAIAKARKVLDEAEELIAKIK